MSTDGEPLVVDALDEAALEQLGARLGEALEQGLVTLSGPLGVGKTSFCRGLLRGRGHAGPVKSPTYTLVESYPLEGGTIHHFDLYRLADPEELEYMGLRDYLTGDMLCLLEWPERAEGVLPPADISLSIKYLSPGRRVMFWAHTGAGRAALARLDVQG